MRASPMLTRFVRTAIAIGCSFSAEATSEFITTTSSATSNGGRDTLRRRLLKLVYPKRSAAITIRKWTEEGKFAPKYELKRVVRDLRKLKRYKHALEICEWMRFQKDIKLLPGDYAVHLDLIAKVRGLASAEKFIEELPEGMIGQPTCGSLLHIYVENKLPEKAEALMKKMSEWGFLNYPLPYNHMLSLYISTGQLDKVPMVVQELKKTTSPDVFTFNLLLTVCSLQKDVQGAENIFLELKDAKLEADWLTYSTLTSLYIKNDLLETAATTLDEMEKRVTKNFRVAYPSLISLHASMGDKDGVHRIWNKIKSTFSKINNAEYTCMIASLLKLNQFEQAENIYSAWESLSGRSDAMVSNLLLAAYINKDQMERAERFYEQMVQKGISPNYTTVELLTLGYLKMNKMDKVLDYFKKSFESIKRWHPNNGIIRDIFKSLELQGDIEHAEQLLVILRNAGHVTTETYKSLLRTYEKAAKMPLKIAEWMKKDKVQLDEETHQLIKSTGKLRG